MKWKFWKKIPIKDKITEVEWESDCWDSLSEERKQELMKQANELFNSDLSPLAFMVQSNGSIGPSKLTRGDKSKDE